MSDVKQKTNKLIKKLTRINVCEKTKQTTNINQRPYEATTVFFLSDDVIV